MAGSGMLCIFPVGLNGFRLKHNRPKFKTDLQQINRFDWKHYNESILASSINLSS